MSEYNINIPRAMFDQSKYEVPFETFDVNNDGKIDESDINATDNENLQAQIRAVLDASDEDSSVGNSEKPKDAYGITQTNTDNFENDIQNSKGTVYLIWTTSGCQPCNKLEEEIKNRFSEIEDVAQVYSIEIEKNRDLFKQITGRTHGVPVILKFVDGKFVEEIESPSEAQKAVQSMIDKAEGTVEKKDTAADDTKNVTNSASNKQDANRTSATKTAEDIKAAADEMLTKYPIENNDTMQALKKALDDGYLTTLSEQGFSKANIVDIISQAYPSAGIKNNKKGGYDCPRGSSKTKDIYNQFVEELSKLNSADATALIAQVKELNVQIDTNNAKLDVLKGTIETLQKDVEKIIEAAIKESEDIQEDMKDESAKIVKDELDKYASSEGSMTYADFQSNLKEKLDSLEGSGSTKLSSVVLKMIGAEGKMSMLKGYIESFGTVVNSNKTLADKVSNLNKDIEEIECRDDEECPATRCDPIGFSANGKRYDFFVDNDNNNDLTNEKEFLGAKNGWAEMQALDTDGDGKVSKSEMAGLKVVTTDDAGNQVIKEATELFADTDSIDLNSYKAINKDFQNGNTLLGSFSMTFNGQEIDNAYNTMDTLNWLDENYEFSDEIAGVGRFAKDNTIANDVLNYENDLKSFNAKFSELETKLSQTWTKVGVTRSDILETVIAAEGGSTQAKADEIENLFKKKAEEEKQAEEDKKADDAQMTEENKQAKETEQNEEDKQAEEEQKKLKEQ